VLLFVQLIVSHQMPWTVILFPLVLVPLVFATMGCAWFLAALGVYVRDIGQVTGMCTTALLFVSPVFYPVSALPEKYQGWLNLNPLTFFIAASRKTLIFGEVPDIAQWGIMLVCGMLTAWIGHAWFQKTRRGFADVL
jgi:lipopolysaccharide transport system permease protein